jgi:hypothetical protein
MENSNVAEDLRFMRLMIERTQRQIDPLSPVMIVWGIICLVGYPASHWLAEQGRFRQIATLWLGLGALGIILTAVFVFRLVRSEIMRGVRSRILFQICMVWFILSANGIIWSLLFPTNQFFPWAMLYAIALSMMGILYTKEWLIAGIGVFVAIIVSALLRPYSSFILGTAMGLGCIIPALIAQKRLRVWKADHVKN